MRSGVVRVEDSEESLYASVDLVADKITRKLQKVSIFPLAPSGFALSPAPPPPLRPLCPPPFTCKHACMRP